MCFGEGERERGRSSAAAAAVAAASILTAASADLVSRAKMSEEQEYEDMHGKKETLYDETGHYDPRKGRSLVDDLLGWAPDIAFRIDAFPPHCLTISGAVSLAVAVTFLLGCMFNVVLPHYERVSHSVQTRCKIINIERDEYIDDALFHYKVKFPLPGIPGLREAETYCYGSQRCSAFELNSAHDCFFNTEDHSVRFYTAMSGHHTIRFYSYVLLMFPFALGACCCLIPASMHWNKQWGQFSEDVKERFQSIPVPWKQKDDEYYQGPRHTYPSPVLPSPTHSIHPPPAAQSIFVNSVA